MHTKHQINRNIILGIGVSMFACMGIIYSWSKFSPLIRTEFSMNHGQVSLAYSFCMAMFTTGILCDGQIGRKASARTCILTGTGLAAAGYLITSAVPAQYGWLIYVTYGPFVGFGVGMIYNEWLHRMTEWFPDCSGRASGALLLGMGLSGVTTTPLMALAATLFGWRISFRLIAGLLAVFGLFSSYFASLPVSKQPKANAGVPDSARNIPAAQMLKQPCFWTFAVWKLIVIGTGQACAGQLFEMMADLDITRFQLIVVSGYVVINGFARLLWGESCDRFGRTITMKVLSLMLVCGVGLLSIAFSASYGAAAILGLLLVALCYGGGAVLGANYISGVFGRKYYRQNNGCSAVTALPANLGATYAIGALRDMTGSYLSFCQIMIPVSAVAVLMSYLCQHFRKRLSNNPGNMAE